MPGTFDSGWITTFLFFQLFIFAKMADQAVAVTCWYSSFLLLEVSGWWLRYELSDRGIRVRFPAWWKFLFSVGFEARSDCNSTGTWNSFSKADGTRVWTRPLSTIPRATSYYCVHLYFQFAIWRQDAEATGRLCIVVHENIYFLPITNQTLSPRSSSLYAVTMLVRRNNENQSLIIESTRCTNFSNLFLEWKSAFSDSSSIHPQEFFTIHTTMVYVIQVCRQLVSRSKCSCSQAVSITCMTYAIVVCTVKNSWWWTVEMSETCRFSFQK